MLPSSAWDYLQKKALEGLARIGSREDLAWSPHLSSQVSCTKSDLPFFSLFYWQDELVTITLRDCSEFLPQSSHLSVTQVSSKPVTRILIGPHRLKTSQLAILLAGSSCYQTTGEKSDLARTDTLVKGTQDAKMLYKLVNLERTLFVKPCVYLSMFDQQVSDIIVSLGHSIKIYILSP